MLAALLAKDGEIVVPRLDLLDLRLLEQLAVDVLSLRGFKAAKFVDEAAARNELDRLRAKGQWPLVVTEPDTSGEKPFEEFAGAGNNY